MASSSGPPRTPAAPVASSSTMAQVGPSTNNRVAKASSAANGSSSHHPSAKKRTTARSEDGSDAARQHKKSKTDRQRERDYPVAAGPRRVPLADAMAGATLAFKPQPIGSVEPSDPDEDDEPFDMPPPPSARKIARRRESTRVKLASVVASPAPSRQARELAAASTAEAEQDSASDSETRAQSLFTPRAPKPVPHLSFKPNKRPRPSAAPPPSPGPSMPPPMSVPRRMAARKSRLGGAIMDSAVPLPISDTPVIDKNRDMRRGDGERRDSLGMRGQRASSSFGRGEPSYPHSSVPSNHFYKHIPPDLPEPVKARWLIAWCSKRAMDERTGKAKGKEPAVETDDVEKLLGDVVDGFVASVARGDVDTSDVFGKPGASTSSMPVKPHPRNVDNRVTLEKEQVIIKRMKAEDRDWSRIAANANAQQAAVVAELAMKACSHAPPDMTLASEWFKRALRVADDVLATGDKDIGSAGNFGQVEFEVDMLHQTTHQAHQYALQARRFLDGIFSSLASDLRARDAATGVPSPTEDEAEDAATSLLTSAAAAAGPSRTRTDPINMLRALASADAKKQSPETLAKAAAVAPVSAAPRAPAVTPRRAGPGATPRRAGVYGRGTPGKQQQQR